MICLTDIGATNHENPLNPDHSPSPLRQRRHTSPHPLQARRQGDKIEQVVSVTEEKQAGNKMMVFRCQSEIGGELKPFEIKFELGTCKWYLWKM